MDESPAVTGLLSVLRTIFGVLAALFSYIWSVLCSLLYLLTVPLFSLGHGLLSIALFPIQVLLKFEVSVQRDSKSGIPLMSLFLTFLTLTE